MCSYEYKSIKARQLAERYPEYYLEFIKLIKESSTKVIDEIVALKKKEKSSRL